MVARFVCHFPPQFCEMQELEANVGISRCERGALALRSFFAAAPNGSVSLDDLVLSKLWASYARRGIR